MSTDNKVNPNDEAVNAGEAAKKATNTLRANLSMNAEDQSVGAGLMAVHMDRGLEKLRRIAKKKERAEKSFNSLIARIDAQIAALNEEINHWDDVANDAQEEIDRLKAEQDKMEEGSDEWKAKQEEIDEQVRIREDALDNKRIAQAEKDALQKTRDKAQGISSSLDDIGTRGKVIEAQAKLAKRDETSLGARMDNAGMNEAALVMVLNGTYEPGTPEQAALAEEYIENQAQIRELEAQIDELEQEHDAVIEVIQKNEETLEGHLINKDSAGIVSTNEKAQDVLVAMGKTKAEAAEISTVTDGGGWGSFSVDQTAPLTDVVADGNITAPKIDLTKAYADAASGIANVGQRPEVLIKQDGDKYDNFAIS